MVMPKEIWHNEFRKALIDGCKHLKPHQGDYLLVKAIRYCDDHEVELMLTLGLPTGSGISPCPVYTAILQNNLPILKSITERYNLQDIDKVHNLMKCAYLQNITPMCRFLYEHGVNCSILALSQDCTNDATQLFKDDKERYMMFWRYVKELDLPSDVCTLIGQYLCHKTVVRNLGILVAIIKEDRQRKRFKITIVERQLKSN